MRALRVVTINMWGDREPLGTRLAVAAAALAPLAVDVILVQEVRRGDGLPCTAGQLAERLGDGFVAHVGEAVHGAAGTWGPGSSAGSEGLAIVSRYPLTDLTVHELPEARPLDRRILLSGRLTLADGVTVGVHTTHLHWRLGDGLAREAQVVAVDAHARGFARPGEVQVVGGDFNAAPGTDEIRFLRGEHTLAGRRAVWQDAWARRHPHEAASAGGWTWASTNPHTAWLAHLALDRRIDYLWVSPEQRGGVGRVLDARVVLDQPGTDGKTLASDHYGVLAEVVVEGPRP